MNPIKIKEADQLIKALYETDDGGVGGYGHIVFDDGNLEDGCIDACLTDARNKQYDDVLSEETRIASIKALEFFKTLTESEREVWYYGIEA